MRMEELRAKWEYEEAIGKKISEIFNRCYDENGFAPTVEEVIKILDIELTEEKNKRSLELEKGRKAKEKSTISEVTEGQTTRMNILNAIDNHNKTFGFSPTIRELCEIVGIQSTSTVHRHLEVLREEGKISWNPAMSRTIKVHKRGLKGHL